MCSVSSSDLSSLDPPPSRYSGDSLERGKGARYTRCTCTRHAFLRGRIVPREEPEGKTDKRDRGRKGRRMGRGRRREGETKKGKRNLFGAVSGYAKVDKRHK